MLHASRARRARPQWTIQVKTPPRAWFFSTWAVLAIMWHLAPGGTPTGTAEEMARDLHTWPVDQDFPWRRPQGYLPVAPRKNGAPLPTDRHGPGRSAGLRVEVGHIAGTTAAGPLDPPTLVLAHGCPGPCHPGPQGGFPTAPVIRRPAPQPAGGSGLDSVERELTPGPVPPPGARAGFASRRRHGNRGVEGDRA